MGSVLGAVAMHFFAFASPQNELYELLILYTGCFLIGLGQGLGQFYRFSAIELSPPEYKSKSVTLVLSGGIIAAFLGPSAAGASKSVLANYVLCYIIMAGLGVLNLITLSQVKFPPPTPVDEHKFSVVEDRRSTIQIMTQPLFILSCTVATMAHTVMVMIMSNCTLAMTAFGFSFGLETVVMEFHFFAMFFPGFFTGRVIGKTSPFSVSLLGALLFAGSAVLFDSGTEEWNFFAGMVVLGVAWNFSFSSGTVRLKMCVSALGVICAEHTRTHI